MPSILVIDDHPTTTRYLAKGLREQRYHVEIAADGKEGLYRALNETFDLIILDVMLPHIDGWQLIQCIRTAHPQLPVLFLTAKDTTEDKVKGLELGADDYLVKPFAFF
jgi:Response regulators consisting of a CheY-like receiver domain and a winged-helix DNA-binding domain